MQYIQESALIPDEVINEALPYSRVGQWAKRGVYGDEREGAGGEGPGVVGKIYKFFKDPSKYEANKEKFQGEQAANWITTKLGPVIQAGVQNNDQINVADLVNRLHTLKASKDLTYKKVEVGAIPTMDWMKKMGDMGKTLPEAQVLKLLQNIGHETARSLGGTQGSIGAPTPQSHDEIMKMLETGGLDDYQIGLLLAKAWELINISPGGPVRS